MQNNVYTHIFIGYEEVDFKRLVFKKYDVNIYWYVYIHIYIYIHTYIYIYIYIHTYIHIYIHTHISIFIYIYINMEICVWCICVVMVGGLQPLTVVVVVSILCGAEVLAPPIFIMSFYLYCIVTRHIILLCYCGL